VAPDGIRAATIHIANGIIARVSRWDDTRSEHPVVDVGVLCVMPGIVDTHVHVNEPGRTEWEGFETATRAAAAGGVTTILDMPLNSIPATTTRAALDEKRAAAEGKCLVNVEYIGGVVPGNAPELRGLRDGGVRAFKCFLAPSGVDEFPAVAEADLREAFPILAELELPLMVHAEDPALLREGPPGGSRSYADYLASRPPEAEALAISLVADLMAQYKAHAHIVHLSSPRSLAVVREARSRGRWPPLSVETCPHYLTFAAEEIPDGATEHKCAPPIRSAADRDQLWQALKDGEIDLIASDHSPCPPSMKGTNGDFFAAWGGIASLELALAAVWTGARSRQIGLDRVARWMCEAPSRLAGLDRRKGQLRKGFDADIVVWDPETSFVVDPSALHHRHPSTPYAGRTLFGVVHATYVGGRLVFGGV
jgi:allantoinase